jgi:hypothetical protein
VTAAGPARLTGKRARQADGTNHDSAATIPPARRADAGTVRLSGRNITGLVLCGDMYGAPYDLSAAALGVRDDRLRGIVARWRRAGYADTGRLGPGPAWCWLTRPGLQVTGLRYAPSRPALARLAHIRAVLTIRLSLQDSAAFTDGRAWWRSERRIRAAITGRPGSTHVPDTGVSWPDVPGSRYGGECWAIEAELTPKPLARTAAIMSALLTRSTDYYPDTAPDSAPLWPGHLPGGPGCPQRERTRRRHPPPVQTPYGPYHG